MKVSLFVGILLFLFCSMAYSQPSGKDLYEKSCRSCHGIDGKGNAKLAQGMKIKPELLDLTKKETKVKTDGELINATRDGTGKMKGLKDKMKQEDIVLAINHLRVLQK